MRRPGGTDPLPGISGRCDAGVRTAKRRRWGVRRREEAGQITPRKELSHYKSGPVAIYVAEIDLAAESKSAAF